MRKTRFCLVQYNWDGDLFSKEGVLKGGVFSPNDDPVVECFLSGRHTYIHPKTGLAFVEDDLGKTAENVIEGLSWVGPQRIDGPLVKKLLEKIRNSNEFTLGDSKIDWEQDDGDPSTVSGAVESSQEIPHEKEIVINRDGDKELEFYGGKVMARTNIHCVPLLQMISSIL